MEQGAVFQSNRSQAIRLPKAVALPDDVKRVDIVGACLERREALVASELGTADDAEHAPPLIITHR